MKYAPETIGECFLVYVKDNFRTQRAAARFFGCSGTFISQVVNSERRPSDAMLKAMGYRHIDAYAPAACEMPEGAFTYHPKEQP